MKRIKRLFALAAAAAAIAAAPASAWNGRAHMIIAAKAWEHLTPQSREAAALLLRHNPMYAQWIEGVAAEDQPRVAFIRAATWADKIKAIDSGYRNDRIDQGAARRNSGYDDCNRHVYWHHKDLPFSPDGTPLRAPHEPNAQTQIELFSQVIGQRSARDELKAYDLVWLLHLVGDAHQPLHATSRFTAGDPDGDASGYDICLAGGDCRRESNLHAFWDWVLGPSENITSVTAAARALPVPIAARAANMVPAAWMGESFELARREVYMVPVTNGLGPYALSAAYRANARRIAAAQASLAGLRLANLINAARLRVRGDPVRTRTCSAS